MSVFAQPPAKRFCDLSLAKQDHTYFLRCYAIVSPHVSFRLLPGRMLFIILIGHRYYKTNYYAKSAANIL